MTVRTLEPVREYEVQLALTIREDSGTAVVREALRRLNESDHYNRLD